MNQPTNRQPSSEAAMSSSGAPQAASPEALVRVRDAYRSLRDEIGKVIVGQDDVVDQALLTIFCRGHALLVGVPGLAKTLLISTIARALNLEFARIQFTPDLMPSDITGTQMIQEDKTTGHRSLAFVKGPIFANIVLADEINRTPPKTQAALLESMQEGQVTIGGERHILPKPFFVLATQNPIEQEGTYPLPEAQLDRFMLQIRIGYPTADEELEIVRRSSRMSLADVRPVLDAEGIAEVQGIVRKMPVADSVARYALRLVRATRVSEPPDGGIPRPGVVRDYLAWGAGPRASEYLVMGARARALLNGDATVTPEHVRQVARPVLRHRLMVNFNAEADQVGADQIITQMLSEISEDTLSPEAAALVDQAIR